MKQQQELLTQALKGDDRAMINLTLLIQEGTLHSTVAKKILGNIDPNQSTYQYLEACLYAFGNEVGKNANKAYEILYSLVNTNHSYATNLVGIMIDMGFSKPDKFPDINFNEKAIQLGNPLALYNFLYTHKIEDNGEWFKLVPKCYHYLPEKLQKNLSKIVFDYEQQLITNKSESPTAWRNLAEFFEQAGLDRKSKRAHLNAAKYGNIRSQQEIIDPLRRLNPKQMIERFDQFKRNLKISNKKSSAITIADMSIPQLYQIGYQLTNVLQNLELERSTLWTLAQIDEKLDANYKECEKAFNELEKKIKEVGVKIGSEVKRQIEIAESHGIQGNAESLRITSERISGVLQLVQTHQQQYQERLAVNKILLDPMLKYFLSSIITRSEKVDAIVRKAHKHAPTFFQESQGKLEDNELSQNLHSILNISKINLNESTISPADLKDQLQKDSDSIKRWVAFRVDQVGAHSTPEFRQAIAEITEMDDVLTQMQKNLTVGVPRTI